MSFSLFSATYIKKKKKQLPNITWHVNITCLYFQSSSGFYHFYLLSPQDNSKWRRHYLNSLYEYMQGNNKEMAFLGEEQEKIKRQDWSDRMVDPPDVRRQYEVRTDVLLSQKSERLSHK